MVRPQTHTTTDTRFFRDMGAVTTWGASGVTTWVTWATNRTPTPEEQWLVAAHAANYNRRVITREDVEALHRAQEVQRRQARERQRQIAARGLWDMFQHWRLQARYEWEEKDRRAIEARAHAVLMEHLDDEQRGWWDRDEPDVVRDRLFFRGFPVFNPDRTQEWWIGERTCILAKTREQMPKGAPVDLCVYAEVPYEVPYPGGYGIPWADTALALKLAIEAGHGDAVSRIGVVIRKGLSVCSYYGFTGNSLLDGTPYDDEWSRVPFPELPTPDTLGPRQRVRRLTGF